MLLQLFLRLLVVVGIKVQGRHDAPSLATFLSQCGFL
jgi:hypothetical protein